MSQEDVKALVYTQLKYEPLLQELKGTRDGRKLAMMSSQVKIERELLAEIMFSGNQHFMDLDFCLEEQRRDLTVRRRSDSKLVDWVEAKMCYTDCLARGLGWSMEKKYEYRKLLVEDANKQKTYFNRLKDADRLTMLTSILFAIHHRAPLPRHKYYPDFKNTRRRLGVEINACDVEREALRHVREEISRNDAFDRELIEEFSVPLDDNTCLWTFVFRAQHGFL